MQIRTLLLKPYLDRFERELQKLNEELIHHPTGETLPLRSFVEGELSEIQKMRDSVHHAPENSGVTLPQNFRQMKLQLRFAKRRWKRLISNEIRFKKIRERQIHVSGFAA